MLVRVMKLLGMALCLVACGKGSEPKTGETGSAQHAGALSRAEWIAEANKLVTASDWRAQFDRLVTADTWRTLDVAAFTSPEVLQLFGVIKRLYFATAERGTADDLVALAMFTIEAELAFLRGGEAFIATFPTDDPTRAVRVGGLEKVRLGIAIELCSVLYELPRAAKSRDAALARLATTEPYTLLSRDTLQLVLVTLDEKILPGVSAEMRAKVQAVRDTIAAVQKTRPEPSKRTYQPYEAPSYTARTVTTVSTTGGFSVALGPAIGVQPLAYTEGIEHWVHLTVMDGPTFEVRCSEDIDAADTAKQIGALEGATRRADNVFVLKTARREGLIRVETLGEKGCLISVEAEPGRMSPLADAFVASFRAS
jgi:hypothetical protein